MPALSALISRRDPPQALERLQYLARRPAELPGASLARVLRLSQPAFARSCPGFAQAAAGEAWGEPAGGGAVAAKGRVGGRRGGREGGGAAAGRAGVGAANG